MIIINIMLSKNSETKPMFKNIEFIRIVACLAIVFAHLTSALASLSTSTPLLHKLAHMSSQGGRAVELFFIISGFLFGLKFLPTQSLFEFLKKKFIRLWPVAIFVMFLSYLLSFTKLFTFDMYQAILNLLGFFGIGLVTDKSLLHWSILGQFWYVSSMLGAMILYFYLLKHFDKKISNFAIGLITYFSYCLIVFTGDMHPTLKVYGVFNIGLLRGLGGVGLGYFIAMLYKNYGKEIAETKFNIKQVLFVSVFEFICLYFTINNLFLHKIKFDNPIIYVVNFTILVTLFIFKKGIFSNLLNLSVWNKFSKYTYSIYMVHCLCLLTTANYIYGHYLDYLLQHPIIGVVIALSICMISGILIYHFVEIPMKKYLTNLNFRKNS